MLNGCRHGFNWKNLLGGLIEWTTFITYKRMLRFHSPPMIANIFSLPCQLDGMGRKQPLSAVAYWKVTRIFRWMYITF